jgi:hypothetical protein
MCDICSTVAATSAVAAAPGGGTSSNTKCVEWRVLRPASWNARVARFTSSMYTFSLTDAVSSSTRVWSGRDLNSSSTSRLTARATSSGYGAASLIARAAGGGRRGRSRGSRPPNTEPALSARVATRAARRARPAATHGWCAGALVRWCKAPIHCASRTDARSTHAVHVGSDPGPCPPLRRTARPAGVGSCSPRRLGGSRALSASVPSSAPDAPDWRPGPRVGTSESGAQPPVGRAKNISHVLCFDVASGVTSEETRLANFYFRTFFGDLVAPGHPWLSLPPPPPTPPRRGANKVDRWPTEHTHCIGTGSVHIAASAGRILGLVRLSGEQCARCARLAGRSEGGHLRIWRAAPDRAH